MNSRGPYSRRTLSRKPRVYSRQHNPVMTIRKRKLIGTVGLLVLVIVWSLAGMVIAQTPWLAASKLAQAIFYVVAGLGWVLPAMPLIAWMSRPDPQP
jgi:predicted membrane channel-forming protein YqfA (hemolysin III family)